MQNFAAKTIAGLNKTCASCALCIARSADSFLRLVRASVAELAPIFKILHAKFCTHSTANCAISVPSVRARRLKKRADSFKPLLTPCHALLRFRKWAKRRWARVAYQNCAGIHRKCRDFNRNSRFLNAKFRGKNNRWPQQNLRIVCIVHRTIGRFVLAPRARVGGRARADFQDFARKILHAFNCKLRNFGAERARKTFEKARRLIQTASDAVLCTLALPKMGWDALGACRVL